jgi:hypothetical protein
MIVTQQRQNPLEFTSSSIRILENFSDFSYGHINSISIGIN